MNKELRRKLCALISSYVVLIGCYVSSCHKDNSVVYNEKYIYQSSDAYAYFNDGKIYICNSIIIDKIRDDSSNDIYIIDDRFKYDPNFRICNSYEITNLNDMNKILEVLLEYEKDYPSDWDRTIKSMRREWLMHNLCYYFDVEKHRTSEVDLNNDDENKYLSLIKK